MANGRRLVVHPQHVGYLRGFADAMRQARAEMSAARLETEVEIAVLRGEVRELRKLHERALEAMRAEQSAQRARAEHREREIARARAAERDPNAALN